MPNVSLIIPCRNEEAFIEKAIRSVLDQKYDQGEIELLVIDGMSDDKTVSIIQSIASEDNRLRLIENPKRITPAAMNLGIAAAKYDFILRLDAHAIALDGFITKSVEAIMKDENICCAGGKIHNIYHNAVSSRIGAAMGSVFGVGNATFRVGGEESYVDTVAFGIFRKKVLNEVGGYDESLVRNEDDDLSFRMIKAGYKILYTPEIESEYVVRASIKKLFRQYYQYGYWKVYVGKKHKAITTVRQLIPLFFVLGLIVGTALSFLHPILMITFLSGLGLYGLLALLFGMRATKSFGGIFVAPIFSVLHFSYGWGYLVGIIHFLIFNRGPVAHENKMSR